MSINKTPNVTPDWILFFDMDGTLINTDYANFLSYKKAIEVILQSCCELTYNPNQRFNRSMLKKIIPNLTELELNAIVDEKEKQYHNYLHKTQINNDVLKILCRYSQSNRTVLVTNCREDRALATLNYHGLVDKFSDLFFRKPNFNTHRINKFQNALQGIACPPDRIIAFENEDTEIADAKKAGIKYINPII